MKRWLVGLSTAALAAVAGGSASAATFITFSSYQTALNAGESLVTNFDSGAVAPGFSAGGNATLMTGSSNLGAAPATSATTRDLTQYLAVQAGQDFTLTGGPLSEISFYVGSLDTYNTITFTGPGGFTQSFTGADLNAATAASDGSNGDQSAASTNGRYTFTFDQAVTGVRLDSSSPSFEVSDIGAIAFASAGGVPEPAAWSLMILGFGGVGTSLRQKRSRTATA
ncbi:PEPxxWA-CTERM sorting domain-containing protein [Phenylobacterium sp.]|uniref:Npun_F0296 family exosortase-dependent surface protein n=1 Tax=Phenylobacterium sp. TaxID=1871053 RepID=UPI0035698538